MFLSASARPSALSTRPARRVVAGAAVWLMVWKPSGALELFAIAVLKEQERGRQLAEGKQIGRALIRISTALGRTRPPPINIHGPPLARARAMHANV